MPSSTHSGYPMFGFFEKKTPAEPAHQKGYRAFPATVAHPSRARRYTSDEFARIEKKQKMQDAPSACKGHAGTTVWYIEGAGYIIEIRFDSHPTIYSHSICTFTPTFGMDRVDGEFAQDVEEFILSEILSVKSRRLEIYGTSNEISIDQYLRAKGFIK